MFTTFKNTASLLLVAFLLCSCSAKFYPLTGSYPQTPIIIKSNKSFEQAWDRLVDVFAQKGFSIKIIDKSSGLIVSNNSEMPATYENEKGQIVDRNAFVVVPSTKIAGGKRLPISGAVDGAYAKTIRPYPVYGEWNVRIKPTENGSTINVNITNLNYKSLDRNVKENKFLSMTEYKSTGVFENILAEMVNQ